MEEFRAGGKEVMTGACPTLPHMEFMMVVASRLTGIGCRGSRREVDIMKLQNGREHERMVGVDSKQAQWLAGIRSVENASCGGTSLRYARTVD